MGMGKKNVFLMLIGCIILLSSCVSQVETIENNANKDLIFDSQVWFSQNKGQDALTRSSTDMADLRAQFMPQWESCSTFENEEFNVLEFPLNTYPRIRLLNLDIVTRYEETQDERYKLNSWRYVFRVNKKTGEKYGYIMGIIPSLDYLEDSNFQPFEKMSYLERNEKYGGDIRYYSLDGYFINGWHYENGKVTAKIIVPKNQEEEQKLQSQLQEKNLKTSDQDSAN